MRILVLGAGMLAHYIRCSSLGYHGEGSRCKTFQGKGNYDRGIHDNEIHFGSRSAGNWENFHIMDIREPGTIPATLELVEPDVVINTAVTGNIGWCERHPDEAEEINHMGQRNVIAACNARDVKLIFISTSSVFGGGRGNYRERDRPRPTTVYGQTKLRGEEATIGEADDWAIFRVTALFGDYPGRTDFVRGMLRDLRDGKTLRLWEQVISPSFGPFVAEAVLRLAEKDVDGIWHIAGEEQLARCEMGEIARGLILETRRKESRNNETRGAAPTADIGDIVRVATPENLPGNRSLCVDKLRGELPMLEFPGFRECVRRFVDIG